MKIAKYGWGEIAVIGVSMAVVAVALWLQGLAAWTALPAGFFLFALFFFRDPARRIPDGPNQLVAPADGTVVDVAQAPEDEFIGGEAGMQHFIAQFGPCLTWPWTKLMDVPELTDELIGQITAQSDAQSGHMSIRDLERLRDDNLVGIIRSLKKTDSAAGGLVAQHERKLQTEE